MLITPGPIVLVTLHWTIAILLSFRILLNRRSHGSSLAWITLTLALPYVGAALYLIVGEVWLPRRRSNRVAEIIRSERKSSRPADQPLPSIPGIDDSIIRVLSAQAMSASASTMTGGNQFELIDGAKTSLERMIADIDAATESCFVLTYIWHPGGATEFVAEALTRAMARGIDCRVLADAHGSARFLSGATSRRLRDAGVRVVAANRAGWLRLRLARIDLRNHRKIVTIDGWIGYTGSLNIVDPARFNLHAGVGRWVDCVVRVVGPAARELQIVFIRDWRTEMPSENQSPPTVHITTQIESHDGCAQVLPSGPAQDPFVLRQMLLTLAYSARSRLVITTPYFVPDEAMLTAMMSAAHGGVTVQLVIPAKIDAVLVQLATRSYFQELLGAGVEIHEFTGGLLHYKTVTVDGTIAMIGTANMDLRSFELNLEISMCLYDLSFANTLLKLQESYIAQSCRLDATEWAKRSRLRTVLDNAAQLVAPIL